jgi:hypothetical protein
MSEVQRMIFMVLYVLALVGAGFQLLFSTQARANIAETSLLWLLAVAVGIAGIIGFIGHVFLADRVARSIGWPIGSPFQTEMGVCNLAGGTMGLLCIRYRGGFWAATIVMASVVPAGAGSIHVASIVREHNFAPNNTFILLPNFLIPLTLLALSWPTQVFGTAAHQNLENSN